MENKKKGGGLNDEENAGGKKVKWSSELADGADGLANEDDDLSILTSPDL